MHWLLQGRKLAFPDTVLPFHPAFHKMLLSLPACSPATLRILFISNNYTFYTGLLPPDPSGASTPSGPFTQ
jgi:hypothetical protein